MSITNIAKQKFAASALALTMAFAPMAANDAQAGDRGANVSTSTASASVDINRTPHKYWQGVFGNSRCG